MRTNYFTLSREIDERINPEHLPVTRLLSEELSTISYSNLLLFIRNAMRGVDETYTTRSKEAGKRVKEHITREVSDVSFKFQGSVMTNTHIKAYSDIDLLTISDKFYNYDSYQINTILENYTTNYTQYDVSKLLAEKNATPYFGNSNDDLFKLRTDCEKVLQTKYNICDITKSKSIKITNQDLKREVDVVIANWYDDVDSILGDKGENRGVQIFNKHTRLKGSPDYPFIRIKLLNDKANGTNGRLRKMIRFLKNVKAFSDLNITLTSFDFNAICYDINVSIYIHLRFFELVLVLYNQVDSLCENKIIRDNLKSIDGKEYIFRNKSEKIESLLSLRTELAQITRDLYSQNILK